MTFSEVAAGAILKLGDILVVEPGNASVSVVDAATGVKTIISQGGLLWPLFKVVGVALARDGDVIVVVRDRGLIRVNPVSGVQSVLAEGGLFKDPWAIAVDHITGAIYVADSGYDNDRSSTINEAGKIIKVDPVSGAQQLIAVGSACNVFPSNAPCQNTTSAGSYLAHPYGIAIDYTGVPGTLIVADMSAFNGKGAIFRVQPVPGGAQTLLWGPSSAVPAPLVSQQSPLGCPMGVEVEPNGNILTSVFTYPVPPAPVFPAPAGTYYGCTPPGIYRIDLVNHTQSVLNANAPAWQPNHAYALGNVVFDAVAGSGHVHSVITAGVSQGSAPNWNGTEAGTTFDGSTVWKNIGRGANWIIPFGLDIEPAPTPANPSHYNVIVGDEGHSMMFRLNPAGAFLSPVPLASNLSYVTSVDVISFTPPGGFKAEPIRSNGQPTGTLLLGTTQVNLGLTTDVNATCRYSLTSGVSYQSMTATFATTGALTHSTPITGLANGASYTFYVRCAASAGSANTDDYTITFSVGPSAGVSSNFSGVENPLSENGAWDSPGAWTDLQKNNGAFAVSLNAQARRVSPLVASDQYSEITYSQDPGSSGWVGVTTRTQSSTNGSGYLAIAYAGEARLYRTDDFGSLSFTLLASASANLVATPGRLRLESQGNTHRVFFNGTQVISHIATGTVYSTGQPGIAASVFGGPQVKMLSFEGGAIGGGPDTTPPIRSNGLPVGSVSMGTTQTILSLTTNENATCRYATTAGTAYASMPNTFVTTGGTGHSTTVNGLVNGGSYNYYIRCQDIANNVNIDDFAISFTVATQSGVSSNFAGVENPLSENGVWDSPGAWADLQKNNGAFAVSLNAQARRVSPLVASDQYSEITYSQDPGSSGWVGVTTRIQSSTSGSGYLAIAYAGEARLYRTDDFGSLSFTLLASASANLVAAPGRLRLESQGNTHRVFFNGTQVISHIATGTVYSTGQPGIAASVFGGPQVKILSFEGGAIGGGPDTTPPIRSNGLPVGSVSMGTTQTILSLTTNENATCRYATTAGTAYASMPNTFTTTGGTGHSTTVNGLVNGGSYNYYIRCQDIANNVNIDDFAISFTVATQSGVSSNFAGVENPLSENGVWDSPGAWTDLQKNNGAFAVSLNAQARRVSPLVASDQYSEITYSQDPGSSGWVGVTTRTQSSTNGSGYLAIAYAGEARLYRTDDFGSLSFTLLASASANLVAAPGRLRLESQGNTHRVFFNGTQVISHIATGTVYSTGQPGIAASVFGGPQVKILSFEGGAIGGGQ